jgi:hypothetical protein
VPSFLYQAGFLLHAQHDLGSCARLDLASGLGFRVGFPVAGSCLIFHLSHRGFVSPFDLAPSGAGLCALSSGLRAASGPAQESAPGSVCFTWIPFLHAEYTSCSRVKAAAIFSFVLSVSISRR